jgi:ABC-type bacteriocin/lantibiotic exporter with double-glycine peptidase domain
MHPLLAYEVAKHYQDDAQRRGERGRLVREARATSRTGLTGDDISTGAHYLRWVSRTLRAETVAATVTGVIWMSAQAVEPAVLGVAIDQGVTGGRLHRLLMWAAVLLGLGLVQVSVGVVRHRYAVMMRLRATYRTTELVGAQAARLGARLDRDVARGEVVSVAGNDIAAIGSMFEAWAQVTGSVAAFAVVAVVLLCSSLTLGAVVLIGVPALAVVVGPLLRPLQQRNARTRSLQTELNGTASDIVAGLRVLRGIGGEQVFAASYRARSQRVRAAGTHAAGVQSRLNAFQVLLPGLFVVIVVWLGARFAARGVITPGQLVALYGYASFLLIPLRTVVAFAGRLVQARVAADHVASFLAVPHTASIRRSGPVAAWLPRTGAFTVVTGADPVAQADLSDLLRRSVGGTSPDRLLMSEPSLVLFSGSLRGQLDPFDRHTDAQVLAALDAASALDVVEALGDGLAAPLAELGRSLSGGQRQRLMLARALLFDPAVLVLVEPTSAVDAHTESRIATRLPSYRAGRTTVVFSNSPLMLAVADEVHSLDPRATPGVDPGPKMPDNRRLAMRTSA